MIRSRLDTENSWDAACRARVCEFNEFVCSGKLAADAALSVQLSENTHGVKGTVHSTKYPEVRLEVNCRLQVV